MSVWDTYSQRSSVRGDTKRAAAKRREIIHLQNNVQDSLSYHNVLIDGVEREVAIRDSDNLNEKVMLSLPGENFRAGSYVYWADNFWLIMEKDANREIYTRVKLSQCNHLLKWIDNLGVIREQWCIIEDGTKYLTGAYEDRQFIVNRGDTRIAMFIGKNEHTVKLGRDRRFIIDDPDADDKLAYILSKPLKTGRTYAGEGIYGFVLQEGVTTNNDHIGLGIADYYKHFVNERPNDLPGPNRDREGWI